MIKNSTVLFIGNLLATGLNVLLISLLTHNLSIAEFGLIITALMFSQLIFDFFELGINPATINFLASADNMQQKKIMQKTFNLKVFSAILISILTFLLAYPISIFWFHNIEIIKYIQIFAIGIFLMILVQWGLSVFQAKKNFLISALILQQDHKYQQPPLLNT